MKILIGTPVHQDKEYCMERWVENVSKLLKKSPCDVLIVDNSPDLNYIEKIKGYFKKYGVKNYLIKHLDINQNQPRAERIGRSREIIRQHLLTKNYDAWFSWESDQIIPVDTLQKLIDIMQAGNYTMVHPNSWGPSTGEPMADFGVCLIKRSALEKYGFLLEYPNMRDCWHGGEAWFKKQVLKGGGSYIEIYGIINPIYHLQT
jgi:hypothetical protein